MERVPLTQNYKGYTISGDAQPVHGYSNNWCAATSVLLIREGKLCIEVHRFQDRLLAYDDEDLTKWFGLFLAQIAVDYCLPKPSYYLRPMDFAWAVDILRRAAEECKTREIRRPKLYEALDFLAQSLDQKWLVRRYRRGLIGDRRDYREKEEQRETLRIAIRGIQQACVAFLLRRMNDLAVQYRDNKTEIDKLRGQLSIVRKAVRF